MFLALPALRMDHDKSSLTGVLVKRLRHFEKTLRSNHDSLSVEFARHRVGFSASAFDGWDLRQLSQRDSEIYLPLL